MYSIVQTGLLFNLSLQVLEFEVQVPLQVQTLEF
jgi:hypothetical protein